MSNESFTSTTAEAAAIAAVAAAAMNGGNHGHNNNTNNTAFDAWVVQEVQRALFSPTAATPLFDSFTSPVMGTATMSDFMDTPLFNDMDDFPMQTEANDDFSSLFPTSNVATNNGNTTTAPPVSAASMFGQKATAAIVAAANAAAAAASSSATSTPLTVSHDLFPDMMNTSMADNGHNKAMSVSWTGDMNDPSSEQLMGAMPATFGSTKVKAMPDGSFAVTTKRGTMTISSSQVSELLSGSAKRKRPTPPSSVHLARPGPTPAPLGAGGVRLLASTAPSPATPMLDSMMMPPSITTPPMQQQTVHNNNSISITGIHPESPPGDNMDALTLKRFKNTAAAQRSRLRKVLKMEALERRVRELETDNVDLRTKLAVMDNERSSWRLKEEEMREQVRTLERRLDEAHRSLREGIGGRRD
ncbi:hypothetical protein BDF19DRAFT_442328 [Syncephalis fuscata]|nr:hypothetical protein BDF19DRAFT_442328 [Syncephalis fuscata]